MAGLESYNLFKSKAPDEQAEAPEKPKNALLKSLDSFKEIGTGFMDTLRIRADKATDSPIIRFFKTLPGRARFFLLWILTEETISLFGHLSAHPPAPALTIYCCTQSEMLLKE
ncbi:hypothetical protein GC101_12265 [Paenibacillus sp. LMG 31459]|uniref:Uncharacterized protein n=1 Tax=Paenibacillus phytohabitans TaxID=2654978 RepID=A0ABX1YF77_9BACL|nr:hypothetical protein [Paenibacillus phytohabitans]NOU79650.1 hypothetical protein [Paenibacillus phytohabitans]